MSALTSCSRRFQRSEGNRLFYVAGKKFTYRTTARKCVRLIVYITSTVEHVACTHPNCYYAERRGQVISAYLSRSPVSSDCAIIHMGCSVSSRYTFPGWGLARRCLSTFIGKQSNNTTNGANLQYRFVPISAQ